MVHPCYITPTDVISTLFVEHAAALTLDTRKHAYEPKRAHLQSKIWLFVATRACGSHLEIVGYLHLVESYHLGLEHSSTLTSMNNLALTFWNQDRWREAKELLVQVIRERSNGIDE